MHKKPAIVSLIVLSLRTETEG